jgi:exopolysaccharide biosynthesis polyprenyl glycosylphosphotransferase
MNEQGNGAHKFYTSGLVIMSPGTRSDALAHKPDCSAFKSSGAVAGTTTETFGTESKDSKASARRIFQELAVSPVWQLRIAVFIDVLITGSAVFIAYWLSPMYSFADPPERHAGPYLLMPVFSLCFLVAALAAGLYEIRTYRTAVVLALTSCLAVGATWSVVLLFVHFVTYQPVGRLIVGVTCLIVVPATVISRRLIHYFARSSTLRLVLFGDENGAQLLARTSADMCGLEIEIVSASTGDLDGYATHKILSAPSNFTSSDFDAIIVQNGCSGLLLDYVIQCLHRGAQVESFESFFESTFEKVPIEVVDSGWALSAGIRATKPSTTVIKRTTDILLSLTGLVMTFWLWPVIAFLIKATSHGPILYFQERVGRSGKPFRMIKFRTMRNDAEFATGPRWADKDDIRVTAVGAVLRKLRLDEIPQFINVLRGDMSVVGPRPERPEFVSKLAHSVPHYELRHLVKPGITGWAQIMYPYGASIQDALEKLRYDLYYVKHGTLTMDVRILIRTIGAMVQGAR